MNIEVNVPEMVRLLKKFKHIPHSSLTSLRTAIRQSAGQYL